jgi:hypothetical protein
MATINNPRAGVSPFQGVAPALPTTLRAAGSLRASDALSSTVSAAATSASNTIVNGQEALNQLINTSRTGVFAGANVTINLEEQQFSTTNQVTSTTNYPSGGDGAIQFNSGANSFASDVGFTYTESNIFTPGIRTDGYFYSNGAPFLAGGNAAIGNFVFNGDTMSTSDLGNTMFITAPSAIGGVVGSNLIMSAGYTTSVTDLPAGNLVLQAGNTDGNSTGGSVLINAGLTNSGNSALNGNIVLTTLDTNSWIFAASGNLTFPTGMHIDNEGPNTRISQNDGWLKMTAGGNAQFVTGWAENELTFGNVAQIVTNGLTNLNAGNLQIKTGNLAAVQNIWNFTKTANLVLPGSLNSVNDLAIQEPPKVIVLSGADHAPCNGTYTRGPNGGPNNQNQFWYKDGDLASDQFIVYVQIGGSNQLVLEWQAYTNDINPNLPIYINTGSLYDPLAQWDSGYGSVPPTGTYTLTQWTFDATGNLVLPEGTPSINYANGSPYGGSGNASFLSNGSAQFTLLSDYSLLSGNTTNPHNFKINDTYTPDIDLRNASGTGMFTQGAGATIRTAGTYNWTFGSTGNTQFPTGIVFADTDLIAAANTYIEFASHNGNTYVGVDNDNAFIQTDFNANNYTWSFNSDASVLFPYQPTNQRTGSGEALIFAKSNNQKVIATAPGDVGQPTVSRLVIAGGDGFESGEGGDIYLWAGKSGVGVAGGSGGGDIKVDAGDALNGAQGGTVKIRGGNSYDQGIGGGVGGFVEISAGSGNTGGPVTISSGQGNSQANSGFVQIQTPYGGTWYFDNYGNLTTPGASGNISGADVITANVFAMTLGGNITEGNIPAYTSLTGNTIVLTPSGGTSADQQLVIYPTVIPGADANHLHLTSGNLYNTELFLGDDFLYVKLANTGNVVVNSNDLIGNSAQWTFTADGNLTLPHGTRITDTSDAAIAIGVNAGTGSSSAISIGTGAGNSGQSFDSIAIGGQAGANTQGGTSIAIGSAAGANTQGVGAVAIGSFAGNDSQGAGSIAIGASAGETAQGNNSIILNASGSPLNQTTANTFTVAPVRNDVSNVANSLYYNTSTFEVTYGPAGGAASVPGQNILPTIQSIAIANTSPRYLLGGGQGYANVTVSNVIPVTEYGVIVTNGTSNQKYAIGALGNIPGTEQIPFTTGQSDTQFTVYAYVTSNAGTFYSNSSTGYSGLCLLAGTQIALSDGSHKAIEDITYTDKLLTWDFDRGCYAETTALWIKRSETGGQYNLLTFSDGTTLRTFDQHRIFNKQAGAFTYPMTDATPIGTVTVNEHGQEITLTRKQVIQDTIDYYNVITDHHMNLFSDSVLTSCRFNNIYPIVDMKFTKDSRTPRTRAEFANIPDRFFHGLRLSEQTVDVDSAEWYVNRLLATEVSAQVELVS